MHYAYGMYAKPYPKTNISRAYYKHLVDTIEHDPLVKHSTMAVCCLLAAISILLGGLVWFANANPGNLIQTQGTVASISNGKTDSIGTVSTFITFDFTTREGEQKSVRQITDDHLTYSSGQIIKIGYHPNNPNYARNLHDNRPPLVSQALWTVPFIIMIGLIFVALFRYAKRQQIIWEAAEAANSDE